MEVFKKFNQSSLEERFAEYYKQRTFFERYYPIYAICIFFALVFQVLSALSGYQFFSDILSVKITQTTWLIVVTVTAQIIIEVLKYFVVGTVFRDLFAIRTRPDVGLTIVAILLSGLSVYSSVIGGGKYGVDNAKVETTFNRHDSEIKAIRSEIEAIKQRNTWKGQTWLNKREKELIYQKENQLAAAIAARDNELAKVNEENTINETTYRYGFALFELGFLLCVFFQHKFGSRVAIESGLINADFKKLVITFNDFTEHSINKAKEQAHQTLEHLQKTAPLPVQLPNPIPNPVPNPVPERQIGFTFGWQEKPKEPIHENRITKIVNENRVHNLRICKNCGKEYIYKHHKQIYCCEECRIESWEKRTGKPFNLKK
jgi:hypothetical protein